MMHAKPEVLNLTYSDFMYYDKSDWHQKYASSTSIIITCM